MAQQPPQMPPGALFRHPVLSAPPRMVLETGPCAQGTTYTLAQSGQTKPNFGKFDNVDIIRSYFVELDYSTTFTTGASQTLTLSPMAPGNNVANVEVSMQAAYKTINCPGYLLEVINGYRSQLAPKSFTSDFQNGANPAPANAPGSQYYSGTPLATGNLALNLAGTPQSYSQFLEIPVATYFDLYWEIDPSNGNALMAVPRAIVSPSWMAGNARNVTPRITFASLFSNADTYDSPVSKTAADTTSTAVGNVNVTFWRQGWIPTNNALTEPPPYGWQYSIQSMSVQPNQAASKTINLADDRAGQGQILSLVFGCWDPNLNSGVGGWTPAANISTVSLIKGSEVNLRQETPKMNRYRWAAQHGRILPWGLFGYDLALTDDGRLTNENALNTLVEGGCQINMTFTTGNAPGAGSTIYVAIETLQSVTS